MTCLVAFALTFISSKRLYDCLTGYTAVNQELESAIRKAYHQEIELLKTYNLVEQTEFGLDELKKVSFYIKNGIYPLNWQYIKNIDYAFHSSFVFFYSVISKLKKQKEKEEVLNLIKRVAKGKETIKSFEFVYAFKNKISILDITVPTPYRPAVKFSVGIK